MGMMVGVAVGWALKEELTRRRDTIRRESAEDGDQVPRPFLLRAERGRDDGAGRPVPQAEQPGRGGAPPRKSSRPTSRSPTATPTTWPTRSPVAKRTGAHCVGDRRARRTGSKGRASRTSATPTSAARSSSTGAAIKLVPAWHTNTLPGSEEAPFSAEHGIPIGTAGRPLIKIGGDDRLPRRRHLPVQRHEADRRAQPGRRRDAADRRPLHDGPPRRRRRRRVRRRRRR